MVGARPLARRAVAAALGELSHEIEAVGSSQAPGEARRGAATRPRSSRGAPQVQRGAETSRWCSARNVQGHHRHGEAEQSPQTGWPFVGQPRAGQGLPGGARRRHLGLPNACLVRSSSAATRLRAQQLLACGMRALAPAFQNDTGREERIRDRALGMGGTRAGTFWLRMRFGARGGLALPRSASKGQNFTRRIPSGGPSSAGVGFGALARPKNRRHRRDAINATCSHQGVGEPSWPKRPCVSAAVRI